jgi:prolyl-tRNA synthetase
LQQSFYLRPGSCYNLLMKATQLFTHSTKEIPSDETSKNAQLLLRAGFISKEMAGVYAYLPLGLRVIEKIKAIVREEMNAIGGQEIIMTSLQQKELWEKTDRWDDEKVDIWFKSALKNGAEVGFGWSHEEQITNMMRNFIHSYKDLPQSMYQFQTKLRNELRAKSGIMRGREFVMKDMYSYAYSDAEHQKIYDQVTAAYLRIFDALGIGDKTFLTYASGGAFTEFSHEFQTITDAGEDIVYLDEDKKLAVNEEVYSDEIITRLSLDKKNLKKVKTAEVGNIFSFGIAKSKQLDLKFTNKEGKEEYAVLGSYGIGITRLMGVIVELFSDEKGMMWPESISPYKVYLAQLGQDEAVLDAAKRLYEILIKNNVEVFWDDRDARPGEKFSDADLYGFPYRIVVSQNTVKANEYEVKKRNENEAHNFTIDELLNLLAR